jgi:peroxiredoxin Q/BCP
MLKAQDTAPTFRLPDETGAERSLDEFLGSWLIIYFYPKDDTPGCTKEACTIAEVYDEFQRTNAIVLGVSKDSPASHQRFKQKHQLPFTLLADESTDMTQAYGAWQEKSMYGRKYMGTARVTYIIDPDGKVAKVYPKVTPASHAGELLRDLKVLQANR